jgi:hypothetical protein
MLLRISLILAIIAALAAAGLGYYEVSNQIPALTNQRDTEHTAKVTALTDLHKTTAELKKTQADLAQTQTDLADTQSQRDKAVARADAQSKRADEVSVKLTQAMQERDTAQNNLAAYTSTGLTSDQVVALNKSLKDAQNEIDAINAEKVVMIHTITRLTNELAKFIGPETYVKLRADLHGKITTVDPKWDFVVLNIGEDQGAISDGELLVSRDGKLVAKVIIRSVQKDTCIANVVPGWKLGEPIEGDDVSPAHPAPAS